MPEVVMYADRGRWFGKVANDGHIAVIIYQSRESCSSAPNLGYFT
jgi:hypothetical protein